MDYNLENTKTTSENVVWHSHTVNQKQREHKNGHRGAVVWITGLPGSGKSTIAHATEEKLHHFGFQTVVLDGDNLRHGLCSDLGFSIRNRNENARRTGETAKLFLEQGFIVLVALVSPSRIAREKARQLIPSGDFVEVYCRCPISVCIERNPKGLHTKAKNGLIPEFTGISSPYEEPLNPELTLNTKKEQIEESVNRLTSFLLPLKTSIS